MKQIPQTSLKLLFPVLLLLAASRMSGQSAPLKMKEAIDIALSNNYSLKADSMNLLVTQYQNKVQKADFLPQVSYSARSDYNIAIPYSMVPGAMVGQPGKDLVAVQMGTRYSMTNGFEVRQTLIQKSTRIKVNAAGLYNDISRTKHHLTKEELVYQVAALYYALQVNAEMIHTTTQDYNNLKGITAIAKAQFETGILKRIDYESLEINTANKESYLHQLKTDYHDQLAHFNYLLGFPADTETIVDGSIATDAKDIVAGNLLTQRLDFLLSKQLIESKETELKSIHAESKPVLSSYFRFNYQSQFNSIGDITNTDYWYKSSAAGLSVSISIFDGHRRKSRMNVAQSELQQLKFKSEYTRQLAEKEWVTATGNFKKDLQQYRITTRNLALAEKVFTSRKALYTEGVTTLIELLDAESELSQSRNLHIQAMINMQTSLLDIYKAKGTLLTEFLQSF